MKFLFIGVLVFLGLSTGCKSIQKEVDTHTVVTVDDLNANTKTVTETTIKDRSKDESFTLGGSEGEGKTLIGESLISISGVSP